MTSALSFYSLICLDDVLNPRSLPSIYCKHPKILLWIPPKHSEFNWVPSQTTQSHASMTGHAVCVGLHNKMISNYIKILICKLWKTLCTVHPHADSLDIRFILWAFTELIIDHLTEPSFFINVRIQMFPEMF